MIKYSFTIMIVGYGLIVGTLGSILPISMMIMISIGLALFGSGLIGTIKNIIDNKDKNKKQK